MSVIVKYMSMPKNCKECDFGESEDATWYACKAQGLAFPNPHGEFMAENCPLVELPTSHGRLINENDVIDAIHDRLHELQTHKEFQKKHGDIDLLGVMPYIAKIPTVIEAEGSDEYDT